MTLSIPHFFDFCREREYHRLHYCLGGGESMRNLDREPDQEQGEVWKRNMRFHHIGTETAANEEGKIIAASFYVQQGGGIKTRVVTIKAEKDGKEALDAALSGVAEHDGLQGAFNNERTKGDDADVYTLQTLRKALGASHAGLPEALRPTE